MGMTMPDKTNTSIEDRLTALEKKFEDAVNAIESSFHSRLMAVENYANEHSDAIANLEALINSLKGK